MMKPSIISVDLVKMADNLPEKFKKLRGLIIQYKDTCSIATDLNMASEFVNELQKLRNSEPPRRVNDDKVIPFTAIFYSTILLYARATKTSSQHRISFNGFTSQYDSAQKEKHKKLCELRDDAIAHFGPGEMYDKLTLHSDDLLLKCNPNGSVQLVPVSIRTVIQPEIIDTLGCMVQAAINIIDKQKGKVHDQLMTKLSEDYGDNKEELEPIMIESLKNFDDYQGKGNLVQAYFEGGTVGDSRYII